MGFILVSEKELSELCRCPHYTCKCNFSPPPFLFEAYYALAHGTNSHRLTRCWIKAANFFSFERAAFNFPQSPTLKRKEQPGWAQPVHPVTFSLSHVLFSFPKQPFPGREAAIPKLPSTSASDPLPAFPMRQLPAGAEAPDCWTPSGSSQSQSAPKTSARVDTTLASLRFSPAPFCLGASRGGQGAQQQRLRLGAIMLPAPSYHPSAELQQPVTPSPLPMQEQGKIHLKGPQTELGLALPTPRTSLQQQFSVCALAAREARTSQQGKSPRK